MADVADKARRMVLAVEIPRDELALRIGAKCIGLIAPPGTDATAWLDNINAHPGASGDGMGQGFRRAADAAVAYLHECVNNGRAPS